MDSGRLFVIACAMLFAGVLAQASAQQQRYALVIGNAHYSRLTANDQLRNPTNDARDMASELRQLGFQVDLLENAGLQTMENAVARFGEQLSASRDSVGFFYFAGHGVQMRGRNYLIPSNAYVAGPGFLDTTTLQLQSLLDTLHQAGNRLNIIVLDASRNNPFRWTRSLGANRGLAVVGSQPQGSIIAYAAAAGKTAEDGSGGNGVYTGELLKYLTRPGKGITNMFLDVGRAVSQATDGYQEPALYNQFNGDFYLTGPPASSRGARQETPATTNPRLTNLEQQRSALLGQLGDINQIRARRGWTGGILSGLGVTSGGVGALFYFLASSALSSYNSATTVADASKYHSQFETYGGVFLGGVVAGAGLLLGGIGAFASIPSRAGLEAKIKFLDAQIQAVGATGSLGQ